MALERITVAIRELSKDQNCKLDHGKASSHVREKQQNFFVSEDYIVSSDVIVIISSIGELKFPVEEDIIPEIININLKAVVNGRRTIIDDKHIKIIGHGPQKIPASMLQVDIKEATLRSIMSRFRAQLGVYPGWAIIPKFDSLLIFEPGEFCLCHTSSDEEWNIIANMIVALPMFDKDKVITTSEEDLGVMKCVIFHPDHYHNVVETVRSRLALAYNVELLPQNWPYNVKIDTNVDINLSVAVAQHFADRNRPSKLIYLLDNSYTKLTLKWSLMYGSDKTIVFALLAVAKLQGLTACLGLIDYEEQWQMYPRTMEAQLYHLVHLIDFDHEEMLPLQDKYSRSFQHYYFKNKLFLNEVNDDEVCYTIDTRESFSSKSITMSGWGPDENMTEDLWFRRSCVLLIAEY